MPEPIRCRVCAKPVRLVPTRLPAATTTLRPRVLPAPAIRLRVTRVRFAVPPCRPIGWPVRLAGDGPHASTVVCDSPSHQDEARAWVHGITGHAGVFRRFAQRNVYWPGTGALIHVIASPSRGEALSPVAETVTRGRVPSCESGPAVDGHMDPVPADGDLPGIRARETGMRSSPPVPGAAEHPRRYGVGYWRPGATHCPRQRGHRFLPAVTGRRPAIGMTGAVIGCDSPGPACLGGRTAGGSPSPAGVRRAGVVTQVQVTPAGTMARPGHQLSGPQGYFRSGWGASAGCPSRSAIGESPVRLCGSY